MPSWAGGANSSVAEHRKVPKLFKYPNDGPSATVPTQPGLFLAVTFHPLVLRNVSASLQALGDPQTTQ